MLHVVTHWGGL